MAGEQWGMTTTTSLSLRQIADEFDARVRRLNMAERESTRTAWWRLWREQAMAECARASVLLGDRVIRDHSTLLDFWNPERCIAGPPSGDQIAVMGGTGAVYRRIAEGGLGIDDRLGPWNGGFFLGLRLAGALLPYGGRQWYIWERSHRDLVMDIQEDLKFQSRMEKATGRNGIRRLRRCPASFLPAEPPDGASVVAGLFAGSVTRRVEDEDWLELPASVEIIRLLEGWTLLWRQGRSFRGRAKLLVPPFYAPLFADVLPGHSMARFLSLRRPALCPLLPAVCWDLTLRARYLPVIPFTGALPYSCSMRTFRRRRWDRDGLHRTGLELGINGVDQRLRERMQAWYDAQCRMRQHGKARDASRTLAVGLPTEPSDAACSPVGRSVVCGARLILMKARR